MKIVVLDGYTLNPGDLSWDALKELGDVTVYDRTAPGELMERAKGAEVLLTNKVVLDAEALRSLPELKYISIGSSALTVPIPAIIAIFHPLSLCANARDSSDDTHFESPVRAAILPSRVMAHFMVTQGLRAVMYLRKTRF